MLSFKIARKASLCPYKSFIKCYSRISGFRPKKSYYEILGISRQATKSEIRQAFLKLSKQCHPDAIKKSEENSKNDHKKFVEINEAYSVLIKPLTRRDYDSSLDAERYVSNHMRSSAYQTHSHTYRPEAGYTYYRNIYNYSDWQESRKEESKTFTLINNLLFVTFSITAAVVSSIFYYMYNFIEDPKLKKLCTNISQEELDKYDLIMSSNHEGTTVYYYALPKENDPSSYEILAVKREKRKDSELDVLSEVTDVYGNRKDQ